jgi:hypothetical protein
MSRDSAWSVAAIEHTAKREVSQQCAATWFIFFSVLGLGLASLKAGGRNGREARLRAASFLLSVRLPNLISEIPSESFRFPWRD